MVLSDVDIKKEINKGSLKIDPYIEDSLQPSSYDLHLGSKFVVFDNHETDIIDVKLKNNNTRIIDVTDKGYFIIHPNNFILGSTKENIKIPNYLVSRIEGKSSIGRLGLIVHATAGYVDPGFEGTLTLEMFNLSSIPIKIYIDMKIAQLSFFEMKSPSSKSYGEYKNKYQGQIDPTESLLWKDF
jgi:dCTP deaminase